TGLSVDPPAGMSFVAPNPGVPGFIYGLDSIRFVASVSPLQANPATVGFYADNGGHPGDTAIFSADVILTETDAEYDVAAPANYGLNPGSTYWVVLGNQFSDVLWTGVQGTVGNSRLSITGWTADNRHTQGALQIDAVLIPELQQVPEPSAWLLAA